MGKMETVVIEIQAQFRDNTAQGMAQTSASVDRWAQSLNKTRQQTEKMSFGVQDIAAKCKSIAGKAINIPVKIIDYATKPLRGLFNFATSIKGVITGIFAGKTYEALVSSPVNLADQYKLSISRKWSTRPRETVHASAENGPAVRGVVQWWRDA